MFLDPITIPHADVWVLDENGKPTPGVMDLPEGWFCLPPPAKNEGGVEE